MTLSTTRLPGREQAGAGLGYRLWLPVFVLAVVLTAAVGAYLN